MMPHPERLTAVFEAAVLHEPAEREAYLREACEGDADLRQQVEALLVDVERPALIDSPVGEAVVELLGDDSAVVIGKRLGPYQVDSLLGVGGGFIKVPVLNAWCGVPLRAAAATSAFMIGVTASSGAMIYYGHGDMQPQLAAAAVIGVEMGSAAGFRLAVRLRGAWLKLLLAAVLFVVAALMLMRTA